MKWIPLFGILDLTDEGFVHESKSTKSVKKDAGADVETEKSRGRRGVWMWDVTDRLLFGRCL